MIKIVQVKTKKQRKQFVELPLKMYKNNPYFVPPLYMDEMAIFSKKYVYSKTCDSVFFLAEKDGKVVGRIQGIIHRQYNELNNEKRLRFTRFDCIDDVEVAKSLFNELENYGKKMGLDTLCGPLGFSDIEREGLLVFGFEENSTFAEQYNYPYYEKLIESVGLKKEVEWLEFKIKYPKNPNEKVSRVAKRALELNKLHIADAKLSKRKILKKYADGIFSCLDVCYADLYGTVPFTKGMKKQILSQFKLFIEKKWILVILDENDKVVSFAFCMPSIGKALQKTGGKLTPSALIKALKLLKRPKVIEFCLIGVMPEYRARGINSIALNGVMKMLEKDIEYCETNLCLETNDKILACWRYFDATNHKRRRSYVKKLIDNE